MSIRTAKHFRPLTLLGALAAMAVTTSVLAAEPHRGSIVMPSDVVSVTVRYGDLDLSSDTGTAVLYKRITSAARQVCLDDGERNLGLLAAAYKCEERAIAHAVQEVNSSKLAMLYAARGNHS